MNPTPFRCFTRRLCACVLVLAGLVSGRSSPVDDFALREWHASDGLPSEETASLLQDPEGFIWVGTASGLTRFDGSLFSEIKVGPADSTAAPGLRALFWDTSGRLLTSYGAGGLQELDPLTSASRTLVIPDGGRPWTAIQRADDASLWLAREDGTVMRLLGEHRQTFSPFRPSRFRRPAGLATDASGRLWVSASAFLGVCDADTITEFPFDFAGAELRIGSSRSGGVWVIAHEKLLRLVAGQLVEQATLPPLVGAHYVQTMLEDRHGALWLGTRSQGLFVFKDGQLHHFALAHDDVYSLIEDREGNLWAATNGGGLSRLRPKSYRLFDKSVGLVDNYSCTVTQDRDGIIWIGNRDGGVARLAGPTPSMLSGQPGWPTLSALSVSAKPDGGAWVTSGLGLYSVDQDGRTPPRRIDLGAELPIISVTLATSSGALWFQAGAGRVGRLLGEKSELFGQAEGFGGDIVRSLAEGPGGTLWIGCGDGSLWRYDGRAFHAESTPTFPIARALQSILELDRDTLLVGSAGNGLLVRHAGRWSTLARTQGLPSDRITQILSDDRGNVWFGSAHGVFRLAAADLIATASGASTAHLRAVPIGKDDGMKELSCLGLFQPAAWKMADGRLWFATRRGLLVIDPLVDLEPPTSPPVRLTQVLSDDQSLPLNRPLKLAADAQKLAIQFSVLCLSSPSRVSVRYRLDGFDRTWITADAQRIATYPRLPPGHYTFHAAARHADRPGEESTTSLPFEVTPLWWQTLWARLGAALAATVIVIWLVRLWSDRRLKRKVEAMERAHLIERERTRIAQNIHDDVGASLTRVSLLTQQVQDGVAGADHMERIYSTVRDITRAMDEIVWAVNPKYDDINGLAYYIGNFAHDFLTTAGIRCRLLLPTDPLPLPLGSQTRHSLFLCCKEALNNVVKHAGASAVTIAMTATPTELRITLTDDGRGFPTGPEAAPRRTTGGNGLSNLRRRMEGIGGTCQISPAAERGTQLVFTVPFSPAHAS